MKKLELDAFLEYKFLSGLSYSPDGKMAAVVVAQCDKENNSYKGAIWLYKNGSFMKLTGLDKERSFFWEDDTHILFPAVRSDEDKKKAESGIPCTTYYRISTEGGEASYAFTVPFGASGMKKISGNLYAVLGGIDVNYPDFYKMSKEDQEKVVKEKKDNADYEIITEIPFYFNGAGFMDKKRTALFTFDVETGEAKRITEPLMSVMGVEIIDGKVYFGASIKEHVANYDDSDLYVYDVEKDVVTKITDSKKAYYSIQKLGNKLIISAAEKTEYEMGHDENFYELLEDGSLKLFLENDDTLGDLTGSDCRLGHGRSSKVTKDGIYMVKTMRNASHLYLLTENGEMKDILTKEGAVDDFDVSVNGDILVTGLYGTKLEEVYKVENGEVTQISSFNEDVLKDVYLADYKKMTIQSQGWDIDGWVLYPKDYEEGKKYPAILDVHGGPRTVYGEVFYHEMQYWANEGYFVFFCNPVGGAGRGFDFADICDKYGTIDYENIMDFTDAVLDAYPMIDKTRVACTGGSYGGYMSNWILTHTDRFSCIATQRSISNWISFYGVSDIGFGFCKSQQGGDIYSEEGLEKLWEHSPLKYVKNAKTPTLFIHSNEDYRCPMEQGMQLFTALRELGVETRMCYFKGENHELSRSGKPLHRVKRLQEITNWIKKYTAEA